MTDDRDALGVSWLDGAVFVAELVLLGVLAVAGAGLGDSGALRVLLAVGMPVVVAVVWGGFLAPRAMGRLRNPLRLFVKVDLFTVAAVLLGLSGEWRWAAAFWLVTVVVVVAGERADERRSTISRPAS